MHIFSPAARSSKRVMMRRSIIIGRLKQPLSPYRDRKRRWALCRGRRWNVYKPHGSVYDLWVECLELCTRREDCVKWISGILVGGQPCRCAFKINTWAYDVTGLSFCVAQSACGKRLAASARRVIEIHE